MTGRASVTIPTRLAGACGTVGVDVDRLGRVGARPMGVLMIVVSDGHFSRVGPE